MPPKRKSVNADAEPRKKQTLLTDYGKESHLPQDPFSLSREQEIVLRLVLDEGKSVFFTGPAGASISYFIRRIDRNPLIRLPQAVGSRSRLRK